MKQYVLLAGADYFGQGAPFAEFCENRRKVYTQANRVRAELRFTVFDLPRGEVRVTNVTYPGGRQVEITSSTRPFAPVTARSYERPPPGSPFGPRFKDGQRDVMSIVDVYEAIQKIGTKEPGTLEEFSIFSHGIEEGPVLVNSFDDRRAVLDKSPGQVGPAQFNIKVPASMRDPDDKDGRADLDFQTPTMDTALFRKAFARDGICWVWGCQHPREIDQLLTKIEFNPAYRSGSLPDDTEFTFTNLTADEVSYLGWFLSLPSSTDRHKVVLKFRQLKAFLCMVNQSSYPAKLATAADVPVLGALVGTASEYDQTGLLRLMRVAPAHARHIALYRNHLGFELDPESRNYAIFRPGMSCPPLVP